MSTPLQQWAPSPPPSSGPPMKSGRGRRSSPMTWRWRDRLALAAAWSAGIGLCLIAGAIVVYMGYRGIQYLRPSLLVQRPALSTSQSGTGGFLDPLIGTALLTVIGIVLAVPLAVGGAIWIAEYGRPTWLARVVESSIEMVDSTTRSSHVGRPYSAIQIAPPTASGTASTIPMTVSRAVPINGSKKPPVPLCEVLSAGRCTSRLGRRYWIP